MENKVLDTLLGKVQVVREEKNMVTIVYKETMSHIHKDFLKLIVALSGKQEFRNEEKFEVIRNCNEARKLYEDILVAPNCWYTMEEVRNIAFAYAVYLANEKKN